MTKAPFVTLFISMLTGFSAQASDSEIIRVRSAVAFAGAGPEVTLGDIATFAGFRADEQARLSKLSITDSPTLGHDRVFARETLAQVLRMQLQNAETKPRLILPERLVISRKTLEFNRETVMAELLKKFKQGCAECQFEITELNLPLISQKIDAAANWALKVRPELPHGTFSVALEISGVAATSSVFWVTGDVTIRKLVAVATRNIAMGEKFSSQDFTFAVNDITYLSDTTPDQAELERSIASRSVQADQVIGRSALRRESDVRYGQNVKVVTGSADWQLSTEGVAQQNASVGDDVKVKIATTQKLISGTLTEKGVVEVH